MPQHKGSTVLAVTGLRDLHPTSRIDVELELLSALAATQPQEVRFGGAVGVDTVALGAAAQAPGVRLVVYAPWALEDLPPEARRAAETYAHAVVDLHGPTQAWKAFYARNVAMLEGAFVVLAFTDGREGGGTAHMMREARARQIPVSVVPVGSQPRLRENPEIALPDSPARIFGYQCSDAGASPEMQAIRRLAARAGTAHDVELISEVIIHGVENAGYFHCAIVPIPSRVPGRPARLLEPGRVAARRLGVPLLTDWLVRVSAPDERFAQQKGRHAYFPVAEHMRTMRAGSTLDRPAFLLDDILTMAGTMIGAQLAVERDSGIQMPGLALFFSRFFRES